MAIKNLCFNEETEKLYMQRMGEEREDNVNKRKRMKNLLTKAMLTQLTNRQSICVSEYYIQNKTMETIAAELGISKSTVSRHIKAAMKKLNKLNDFI